MADYGQQIISHMLGSSPVEGVLSQHLYSNSVITKAAEVDHSYNDRIDKLDDERTAAELAIIEEQAKQQPNAQVIATLNARVSRLASRIRRLEDSQKRMSGRFDELKAPKPAMSF